MGGTQLEMTMRPGTLYTFLAFLQKIQFFHVGCLFEIILEVLTFPWGNTCLLKKPSEHSITPAYQFYKYTITTLNLLVGI